MQTHGDLHPEQIYGWLQSECCGWYAWWVDSMHRDVDKLKQWSCVNSEVQHGQVQTPVSIRAGGWKVWEDTSEKDLGYLWMKIRSWADSIHLHPESQLCSRPREVWPAGQGGCLCPFCENPPGVLHLTLGPSAQERCRSIGAGPAEGHRNDQMDWTSVMKSWES